MNRRVVGDGMIGRAFQLCFPDDQAVTFYAAGVSNSEGCDYRDFQREEARLRESFDPERTLVYFSTCAVYGPEQHTPYVAHKLAMEEVVKTHPKWLILRLSNVAGRTTNPHTLLNYLFARISRSERITVWAKARRNIIDVSDVVATTERLLEIGVRDEIVNVAAPKDYNMLEIVGAFEDVLGKRAIIDLVDKGGSYPIDVARMLTPFRRDYLRNVIAKYYG